MQNSELEPQVSDILEVGIQMVKSLRILHSVGYVHNDIKPSNILLDGNLNTVLVDFRSAKR